MRGFVFYFYACLHLWRRQVLLFDAKCALSSWKLNPCNLVFCLFALLHINPSLMAFYLCYINFVYFLWFSFLKSCRIMITGFDCVLLQTSLATSSNMFIYSCALYHILASRWQCSSVYDVSQWPMKKQIIIKKKGKKTLSCACWFRHVTIRHANTPSEQECREQLEGIGKFYRNWQRRLLRVSEG